MSSSSMNSLPLLLASLRLSSRSVTRTTHIPAPSNAPFPPCSSSSSFHTSSNLAVSRRTILARRQKQKVLAIRAERKREDVGDMIDPVLGDFKQELIDAAKANANKAGISRKGGSTDRAKEFAQVPKRARWDDCLLKKVVLDKKDIWYAPPPAYPESAEMDPDFLSDVEFPLPTRPPHFGHQLTSQADRDLLFRDLPNMTLDHLNRPEHAADHAHYHGGELSNKELANTKVQVESSIQLMKILDLRNSDSKGIRLVNNRRIVEVFGGPVASSTPSTADSSTPTPERLNTGSPIVQAALLTHRIRLLAEHTTSNPRDVHNRKHLRTLVYQRQAVLKYWKRRCLRKSGLGLEGYLDGLKTLGLDPRGVEGELTVR